MNHDDVPAGQPSGALVPDELVSDPGATDADIRVYAALYSHGAPHDGEVRTVFSRQELADRLNRSIRSVDYAIKRLTRLGYLVIERQYDPRTGAQQPSVYRVLPRPLEEQR